MCNVCRFLQTDFKAYLKEYLYRRVKISGKVTRFTAGLHYGQYVLLYDLLINSWEILWGT